MDCRKAELQCNKLTLIQVNVTISLCNSLQGRLQFRENVLTKEKHDLRGVLT